MVQQVLATSLVAAAAIVIHIANIARRLQFDRAALARGELWRLLTCQFTHWTTEHLFWNVTATKTLLFLSLRRCRMIDVAGTVTLSLICVPLGVWAACPDIATFRGLSGVASALLALVVCTELGRAARAKQRGRFTLFGVVVLVLVVKTTYETVTGNGLFVRAASAGFEVVPLAHLIGFACGGVVALRTRILMRISGGPVDPAPAFPQLCR